METAVLFFIIILVVMFLAGTTMFVLTFRFNKNKQHTILTIIFSVLFLPLIYIPMIFTIGFISRFILIPLLPYSIWMIVWAIKNRYRKEIEIPVCWADKLSQMHSSSTDKSPAMTVLSDYYWFDSLCGCFFTTHRSFFWPVSFSRIKM